MREWLIRFQYRCYAFFGACLLMLALMTSLTKALYFGFGAAVLFLAFFGEEIKG